MKTGDSAIIASLTGVFPGKIHTPGADRVAERRPR